MCGKVNPLFLIDLTFFLAWCQVGIQRAYWPTNQIFLRHSTFPTFQGSARKKSVRHDTISQSHDTILSVWMWTKPSRDPIPEEKRLSDEEAI